MAAAAAAIVVAMVIAAAMSPGTALLAAALGVSVVALLSAASAMLAVPAMLMLVGHRLGGSPASSATAGSGLSAGLARTATRRPVLAVGAALLLVAASLPVLGLRTSAPAAQSLPSGSTARAQYDAVSKSMGPGWTEPFEIVAVTNRGAVTTAPRLAELERVQRKLAKDPAVRAVLGPGTIARTAARLRSAGRKAVAAQRGLPRRTGTRLKALGNNVNSAASGVDSLRESLYERERGHDEDPGRLQGPQGRRRLAAARPQRGRQRSAPAGDEARRRRARRGWPRLAVHRRRRRCSQGP